MKLYKTIIFNREYCLKYFNGYTEFNGERFALIESSLQLPFEHNAIIFGYEYDKHLAETGLTYQIIEDSFSFLSDYLLKFPTFGGYVNAQGHTIEEKGMILIYDPKVSPVSLGSLAYKIAETFRQDSVLVIYNQEAQFIYA